MITPPSFGDYLRHLRTGAAGSPPWADSTQSRVRMSRTELAAKAATSAGYVTKLEQGHAERPSPEIIDKLADALAANPVERNHLHDLAAPPHGVTELEDVPTQKSTVVTAVMKEAVDSMHPHPCGFVDDAWNVLYANAEYARLYRRITDVGNVLRWFFLVPESRAIMLEWEIEARLTVAWLRGLMARRRGDPMFDAIFHQLGHQRDFARMWELRELMMGRHTPYMHVRDLDEGEDVSLLAQVYAWPDPTQAVQMYLGIRTSGRRGDRETP